MEKGTNLYFILLKYMYEIKKKVTKKEIMDTLEIKSDSKLYSLVHYVNNKTYPEKLISFEYGYYNLNNELYEKYINENNDFEANRKKILNAKDYSSPKKIENKAIVLKQNIKTNDNQMIIPEELFAELKTMDTSERNDAIELFKKAYFYKKCAMDLIESSKVYNSIKNVF